MNGAPANAWTSWVALVAAVLAACGAPPAPAPVASAPAGPDPVARSPARTARALPAVQLTRLRNGLTAAIATAATGGDAQIQFAVLAGSTFVAPGLAELTAEVIVRSADPSQGRQSLAQLVADLGGNLKVQLGPLTTWIDISVPGDRWPQVLAALRASLGAPTQSRSQILRMREELLGVRGAEIGGDAIAAMARALLLGDTSPAARLDSIADRDPSEVQMFAARFYRPDTAMLVVETPDDPMRVSTVLGAPDGLGDWRPPPPPPGGFQLLQRRFEPGLYWTATTTAQDRCTVAAVLLLPELAQVDSIDLLLIHSCLTLDGTGGRLERLMQAAGLGDVRWRARLEQTPDSTALVLVGEIDAAVVGDLWRVLQGARRSLAEVEPSPSELQLAKRRTLLTYRLGMLDAATRLRTTVNRQLRGLDATLLERRLDSFDQPAAAVLLRATQAYAELPCALVVLGPNPPPIPGLKSIELLPAGMAAGPAATHAPAAGDADLWLRRAADAVGGRELLQLLRGYSTELRLRAEQVPPVTESLTFRFGGQLHRKRILLEQTIETQIDDQQATERHGETIVAIDPAEVALRRREMLRHPIALLVAHGRGELAFRPIAQRRVGDRDLMVLEATAESFERLRVQIDVESHLIRIVEAWERMPDGMVLRLRDDWSDYRRAGPLRVPYHRLTTIDDGGNRVEAVYRSFTALFAD